MSLPRNAAKHQQQHQQPQPQHHVSQTIDPIVASQQKSIALSAKEKRLLLKKIKDQQISTLKQSGITSTGIASAQLKTFSYRSFSVNDIHQM